MRRAIGLLLMLLLPVTALGCMGVQSSKSSSLIVRLYFEYTNNDATWNGPNRLEVWLYDVSSGKRVEQDHYKSSSFVLGDSLNYDALGAGLYELTIEGIDTETDVTWASDCTGLLLDRFDEIYSCNIWLSGGGGAGDAGVDASQMDAGTP